MNSKMAKAFSVVEIDSNKVEESSTQILLVAQQEGALTLEAFNELVAKAYVEKHWSQLVGRPAEGSTLKPAPPTVRNYVSVMRRMYREGFDVMSFKVMFEVRQAVKMKREPVHGTDLSAQLPKRYRSALKGVKLVNPNEPTGFMFHDMLYYFGMMEEDDRQWYYDKLERLHLQAMKKVAAEQAAAEAQAQETAEAA